MPFFLKRCMKWRDKRKRNKNRNDIKPANDSIPAVTNAEIQYKCMSSSSLCNIALNEDPIVPNNDIDKVLRSHLRSKDDHRSMLHHTDLGASEINNALSVTADDRDKRTNTKVENNVPRKSNGTLNRRSSIEHYSGWKSDVSSVNNCANLVENRINSTISSLALDSDKPLGSRLLSHLAVVKRVDVNSENLSKQDGVQQSSTISNGENIVRDVNDNKLTAEDSNKYFCIDEELSSESVLEPDAIYRESLAIINSITVNSEAFEIIEKLNEVSDSGSQKHDDKRKEADSSGRKAGMTDSNCKIGDNTQITKDKFGAVKNDRSLGETNKITKNSNFETKDDKMDEEITFDTYPQIVYEKQEKNTDSLDDKKDIIKGEKDFTIENIRLGYGMGDFLKNKTDSAKIFEKDSVVEEIILCKEDENYHTNQDEKYDVLEISDYFTEDETDCSSINDENFNDNEYAEDNISEYKTEDFVNEEKTDEEHDKKFNDTENGTEEYITPDDVNDITIYDKHDLISDTEDDVFSYEKDVVDDQKEYFAEYKSVNTRITEYERGKTDKFNIACETSNSDDNTGNREGIENIRGGLQLKELPNSDSNCFITSEYQNTSQEEIGVNELTKIHEVDMNLENKDCMLYDYKITVSNAEHESCSSNEYSIIKEGEILKLPDSESNNFITSGNQNASEEEIDINKLIKNHEDESCLEKIDSTLCDYKIYVSNFEHGNCRSNEYSIIKEGQILKGKKIQNSKNVDPLCDNTSDSSKLLILEKSDTSSHKNISIDAEEFVNLDSKNVMVTCPKVRINISRRNKSSANANREIKHDLRDAGIPDGKSPIKDFMKENPLQTTTSNECLSNKVHQDMEHNTDGSKQTFNHKENSSNVCTSSGENGGNCGLKTEEIERIELKIKENNDLPLFLELLGKCEDLINIVNKEGNQSVDTFEENDDENTDGSKDGETYFGALQQSDDSKEKMNENSANSDFDMKKRMESTKKDFQFPHLTKEKSKTEFSGLKLRNISMGNSQTELKSLPHLHTDSVNISKSTNTETSIKNSSEIKDSNLHTGESFRTDNDLNSMVDEREVDGDLGNNECMNTKIHDITNNVHSNATDRMLESKWERSGSIDIDFFKTYLMNGNIEPGYVSDSNMNFQDDYFSEATKQMRLKENIENETYGAKNIHDGTDCSSFFPQESKQLLRKKSVLIFCDDRSWDDSCKSETGNTCSRKYITSKSKRCISCDHKMHDFSQNSSSSTFSKPDFNESISKRKANDGETINEVQNTRQVKSFEKEMCNSNLKSKQIPIKNSPPIFCDDKRWDDNRKSETENIFHRNHITSNYRRCISCDHKLYDFSQGNLSNTISKPECDECNLKNKDNDGEKLNEVQNTRQVESFESEICNGNLSNDPCKSLSKYSINSISGSSDSSTFSDLANDATDSTTAKRSKSSMMSARGDHISFDESALPKSEFHNLSQDHCESEHQDDEIKVPFRNASHEDTSEKSVSKNCGDKFELQKPSQDIDNKIVNKHTEGIIVSKKHSQQKGNKRKNKVKISITHKMPSKQNNLEAEISDNKKSTLDSESQPIDLIQEYYPKKQASPVQQILKDSLYKQEKTCDDKSHVKKEILEKLKNIFKVNGLDDIEVNRRLCLKEFNKKKTKILSEMKPNLREIPINRDDCFKFKDCETEDICKDKKDKYLQSGRKEKLNERDHTNELLSSSLLENKHKNLNNKMPPDNVGNASGHEFKQNHILHSESDSDICLSDIPSDSSEEMTPRTRRILDASRAIRSPKNPCLMNKNYYNGTVFRSRPVLIKPIQRNLVAYLTKDDKNNYQIKRGYRLPSQDLRNYKIITSARNNHGSLDFNRHLVQQRVTRRTISPDYLKIKFDNVFKKYAGKGRPNGDLISYKKSTEWLRDAGVLGKTLTTEEANDAFKCMAGLKVALNKSDYRHFLQKLTRTKKLNYYEMYEMLCSATNKYDD